MKWLFFLLLLVATAHADEPPADATHLHVLLIADTNDETVGESVKQDLHKMRFLIEAGVPEARYTTTVVEGEGATPDGIRKALAALEVKPTDSLLVYYAGHGAWYEGGHYLRLGDGLFLMRKDLLAAIAGKGPRLAVLVTDCCSTYVGQTAAAKQLLVDPDLFRDLFFRHRGLLDITAAKKGQVAVGDEIAGGYFTTSFVDALTTIPRDVLDSNRDGVIAWDEVLPTVEKETSTAFRSKQPRGILLGGQAYEAQQPHVFRADAKPVGGAIPPSDLRLGIEVKNVEGGIEVVKVHPGTPAAWAGFRPGELITEALVPGDFGEEPVEVKTVEDLRRILASLKGKQLLGLTTGMPGEKDDWGEPKRVDLRVRLSH